MLVELNHTKQANYQNEIMANFEQISQECGNFSLRILLLQQLETYEKSLLRLISRVSLSRFQDGKFKTFQFFTHSLSSSRNTHHNTICIAVCKFIVSKKISSGSQEIFELSKFNRQESSVFLT